MSEDVKAVVIGMDPHKRSATIEVMAGDEAILVGGRPTWFTGSCSPTRCARPGRAREHTRGRLLIPARPTHTSTPALRISHFPDPPNTILNSPRRRLLTQRGAMSGWFSEERSMRRERRMPDT
jgi:hypothetical protein